jgi:hypothetical protein
MHMDSQKLLVIFEGDFADMCAEKPSAMVNGVTSDPAVRLLII